MLLVFARLSDARVPECVGVLLFGRSWVPCECASVAGLSYMGPFCPFAATDTPFGGVLCGYNCPFSLPPQTWRIHRIFNSRTLTRKAPSNKNLLVVVAVLLGFESFIQIIWMSTDLPHAEIVPHPSTYTHGRICWSAGAIDSRYGG